MTTETNSQGGVFIQPIALSCIFSSFQNHCFQLKCEIPNNDHLPETGNFPFKKPRGPLQEDLEFSLVHLRPKSNLGSSKQGPRCTHFQPWKLRSQPTALVLSVIRGIAGEEGRQKMYRKLLRQREFDGGIINVIDSIRNRGMASYRPGTLFC